MSCRFGQSCGSLSGSTWLADDCYTVSRMLWVRLSLTGLLASAIQSTSCLTALGAAKVFCLCYEEAISGPSLPDRLTCIVAYSICASNLGVSSRLNEGTHTAINVIKSLELHVTCCYT